MFGKIARAAIRKAKRSILPVAQMIDSVAIIINWNTLINISFSQWRLSKKLIFQGVDGLIFNKPDIMKVANITVIIRGNVICDGVVCEVLFLIKLNATNNTTRANITGFIFSYVFNEQSE